MLLAEGRGAEAERVASAAAEILASCGERHLLTEALTTWGAALARTNRHARARAALQSAAETAVEAGDPEAAGLAALTTVEELGDRLTSGEMTTFYDRASDPLSRSQHPGTLEVDPCLDGAAALQRVVGRAHYDLLLVGDGLPGTDGLDVVRRARQLPHRRRTPVVMLAAGAGEREAWRAGVDAFLRKPDETSAVSGIVARLIRHGK